MCEQEIALAVGFPLAGWTPAVRGLDRHRVQVVLHGVAIDRVVVPGVKRENGTQLFAHKTMHGHHASLEAAVVADLQCQSTCIDRHAQPLALVYRRAEWLLDQHVLAGGEGLPTQGDMELVGDGEDHGLYLGISQPG